MPRDLSCQSPVSVYAAGRELQFSRQRLGSSLNDRGFRIETVQGLKSAAHAAANQHAYIFSNQSNGNLRNLCFLKKIVTNWLNGCLVDLSFL